MTGKDGYHFDCMTAVGGKLTFWRETDILLEVSAERYPAFQQLGDFPHYYAFSNERERLELYFV